MNLLFFLSIRNLCIQRKRYTLIAIAIIFGFALITTIASIANGSLKTIEKKASRYFAGNVSVTGYLNSIPYFSQSKVVINYLQNSSLPIKYLSPRSTYNNADAVLFFNGETVRQRKLVGVDFIKEGAEFDGLHFMQGDWKNLYGVSGVNGILISISAAKILGCRVGDNIILFVTTDTGQYNTVNLIVRGIFNETSLFGYIAYMRISDLNRILSRSIDSATEIAVYTWGSIDLEEAAEKIRVALASRFKVFPHFASRNERDASLLINNDSEEIIAVLSQNAQLAQIKELVDAIILVSYFTMFFFVTIIMVGILNTYRVLVYERIREIGVTRALGMSRFRVRLLILIESLLLSFFASAMGLALGIILLYGLTRLDLSFVPAAGLFLEGGNLRFRLSIPIIFANFGIMTSATLLAAWGPANKAARISPAEAMRVA